MPPNHTHWPPEIYAGLGIDWFYYNVRLRVFIVLFCLLLQTCSVCLMSPRRFPVTYCTMEQSQRRNNFIQHDVCQSVCICASLLASHACLPVSYCAMKQLQGDTFSELHWLATFLKTFYGLIIGWNEDFFVLHRHIWYTYTHAHRHRCMFDQTQRL